jgi:hypothetical protein
MFLPGEKIYKRLSSRLGNRYKGRIIAIDPKTGKYFLGKDELEVALKAKKKFPGTLFSVFRIGYPTVHKFR